MHAFDPGRSVVSGILKELTAPGWLEKANDFSRTRATRDRARVGFSVLALVLLGGGGTGLDVSRHLRPPGLH